MLQINVKCEKNEIQKNCLTATVEWTVRYHDGHLWAHGNQAWNQLPKRGKRLPFVYQAWSRFHSDSKYAFSIHCTFKRHTFTMRPRAVRATAVAHALIMVAAVGLVAVLITVAVDLPRAVTPKHGLVPAPYLPSNFVCMKLFFGNGPHIYWE